eukprot:Filipodium_phascolosomae@DN1553_c0_g1_i2.p1
MRRLGRSVPDDDVWIDEDPIESTVQLDKSELRKDGVRYMIKNCSASPHPVKNWCSHLLLKAELHLMHREFRDAMVCCILAQDLAFPPLSSGGVLSASATHCCEEDEDGHKRSISDDVEVLLMKESFQKSDLLKKLAPEGWFWRLLAVKLIAAYQLNDTVLTKQCRSLLETKVATLPLSSPLLDKLSGTLEVLDELPKLLAMMWSMPSD